MAISRSKKRTPGKYGFLYSVPATWANRDRPQKSKYRQDPALPVRREQRRGTRTPSGTTLRTLLLASIAAASVALPLRGAAAAQPSPGLFIRASDFFTLQRLGESTAEEKDSLPGFRRYPFGGTQLPEASILAFEEKPDNPKPIPSRSGFAWVNMGVYVFETDALAQAISGNPNAQDFGRDLLPHLVQSEPVFAYPFRDEKKNYWRDIGTLDSYYDASMDLVKVDPAFNLYDTSFPIHSSTQPRPPAKMVFAGGEMGRVGVAHDSLICNGCVISGGRVERSILSPDVRINSYSLVEDSILFHRVEVGRYAKIRRAIIDKDVKIAPGFSVGYNLEEDAKRFTVTDSGVVVIGKGERIEEGS